MKTGIEATESQLRSIANQRYGAMFDLTTDQLNEAIHLCGDAGLNEDWFVRTAAEINKCAAELILEGREK
jgi:hypothetical protein